MDILGYRDFIKSVKEHGNAETALRSVHRALTSGRRWLDYDEAASDLSQKTPYVLKAFTDNIVIGWPVYNDAEHELGNTLQMLAGFQLQMILEGFFVRGAISIGSAYVDDTAVFGDALLEAYEGESMLARDPRIILTASARAATKQHLTYYPNPLNAPHNRELLRDTDGQWFLSYLENILLNEEEGPFYGELLQHKTVVEEKLSEFKRNPPIWSKYAWTAAYHNYFCSLYPGYFNDTHQISIELFRASPGSIVG